MIDWLAMIVASRCQNDEGNEQWLGAQPVEYIVGGRSSFEDDRALTGIIQDQTREDHARPGEPDRPRAEMPHVGIERLGPGHAEEDTAQNNEASVTVRQQIAKPIEGIQGCKHRRMPRDPP
jgi:hypothetical protein